MPQLTLVAVQNLCFQSWHSDGGKLFNTVYSEKANCDVLLTSVLVAAGHVQQMHMQTSADDLGRLSLEHGANTDVTAMLQTHCHARGRGLQITTCCQCRTSTIHVAEEKYQQYTVISLYNCFLMWNISITHKQQIMISKHLTNIYKLQRNSKTNGLNQCFQAKKKQSPGTNYWLLDGSLFTELQLIHSNCNKWHACIPCLYNRICKCTDTTISIRPLCCHQGQL